MVHMKNLKQALSHGLFLKNVHKVKLIKIVQYAWLKLYIYLNADLRKIANNDFQNYFFNWTNNAVFGKTMENVRKRISMKLLTTEKRRSYLA